MYRRSAQELKTILEAAGTLVDWCNHPGTYHCSWTTYDLENTDMFFDDFKKALAHYLFNTE